MKRHTLQNTISSRAFMLLLSSALTSPLFASTTTIDPALETALTSLSTASPVVQQALANTPDSHGMRNLDVLHVVQARDASSPYTYLGTYHRQYSTQPALVGLVGSNDLQSWTPINNQIDGDWSSQADFAKLPDGSYLILYENNPSAYDTSRGSSPNWRIRHYANYTQLAAGIADRQFDFQNTLSSTHCAEGTPNIRKVTYNGSVDNSVIEIGFHYCNLDSSGNISATTGVKDSVARGTLTNFRLWRSQDWTDLNRSMRQLGVVQVGQMNTFQYQGNTYTVLEGQTVFDNFGSFKIYIVNEDSGYLKMLNVTTPGGSYSLANPRIGFHYNASGTPDGIIGTYAALAYPGCPGACPGTGESGSILFKQSLSGSLAPGAASFTNLNFFYNPVFSICSNGCQGILLANQNLYAGTGTSTDIGGVSTTIGYGQRHIVYGPYITTLPPLPLTAVFKVAVGDVSSPSTNLARLEVTDTTTGTIIASRELYRSDFHHANVFHDQALAFNWAAHSGHQVEFRIFTKDNTTIKVQSVGVYQSSYTFFCPGELSITGIAHSTGSSCISNSTASNGNLVFGPYYGDFPGKPTSATFSLRASSLTVSGATPVATIDVHAWNPSGAEQILASASINANQLSSSYQTFVLSYNTKNVTGDGWRIETRVAGLGRGLIENQWVFVTPQ